MEVALKIILVIASLGLIAAVLLQPGKSAGLSGAISGGAEHLFGKQKARGLELFFIPSYDGARSSVLCFVCDCGLFRKSLI